MAFGIGAVSEVEALMVQAGETLGTRLYDRLGRGTMRH